MEMSETSQTVQNAVNVNNLKYAAVDAVCDDFLNRMMNAASEGRGGFCGNVSKIYADRLIDRLIAAGYDAIIPVRAIQADDTEKEAVMVLFPWRDRNVSLVPNTPGNIKIPSNTVRIADYSAFILYDIKRGYTDTVEPVDYIYNFYKINFCEIRNRIMEKATPQKITKFSYVIFNKTAMKRFEHFAKRNNCKFSQWNMAPSSWDRPMYNCTLDISEGRTRPLFKESLAITDEEVQEKVYQHLDELDISQMRNLVIFGKKVLNELEKELDDLDYEYEVTDYTEASFPDSLTLKQLESINNMLDKANGELYHISLKN